MSPVVPTPVAAAIGLVPAVLDGLRRVPAKAVQLPVLALSSALTTAESVRREYDDLAERGERLVSRLRGTSFDEIEDKVEDVVARTPLAGAYDAVEDALEDAGEKLAQTAGTAQRGLASVKAAAASRTPAAAATSATGLADDLNSELTGPSGRIDTAASPEVVAVVNAVADEVTGGGATPLPKHDELPLPDYDHMTLGSLRGRLRSLDLEQLVVLRDYEKAKADRLPVVTMLDNRIAKLASNGDQPSGEPVAAPAPEQQLPVPATTGKVRAPSRAKGNTVPHTKVRHT